MPFSKSKIKPITKYSDLPVTHLQFEAIGTLWSIDLYQSMNAEDRSLLFDAVKKRIDSFDKNYSRFRPDSMITAMANKAGEYRLPSDAKPLLDLYLDLYNLSGGKFTPLIGQVLVDAGYDSSYSLQVGQLSKPPTWQEVLSYDYPALTLKQAAWLDFGAAGKGYIVDIIGELLKKRGIKAYCVNAGGDLLYHNSHEQTLSVGLEHPDQEGKILGEALLINQSLCGSAGNQRSWGGFNHIINPETLTSPTQIKAIWVTTDSTILADGLTTCLFFIPAKQLQADYNFEYAIVYADYSLEHSPNFPARFYTVKQKAER
jgi:thiamine biosynthesis lipoprotein